MVNFERTQRDFVRKQIRELTENSRIGKVVEVFEHTEADDPSTPDTDESDESNFEVDVLFPEEDVEHRGVPYLAPASSSISVPKVGDTVLVDYRRGAQSPPIAYGFAYTNIDRAPLGRAGMWRQRFDSDESPSGKGDVFVTGYTSYDEDPAKKEKSELAPEETWIQIAKHEGNPDPEDSSSAPMVIEMYDSPTDKQDESHIKLSGNQVDGDDTQSLDLTLDLKTGTLKAEGSNTTSGMTTSIQQDVKNDLMEMVANDGTNDYSVEFDPSTPSVTITSDDPDELGFKLDFNTGEFKIIDGSGYGIVSDGSGNFTWHYESIDYSQGTTTTL